MAFVRAIPPRLYYFVSYRTYTELSTARNSLCWHFSTLVRHSTQISFGVTGAFLSWLRSFLVERSFCVVHGSTRSPWVPAPYGLPQGSVLGPLLYLIYTSDLATLLASNSALAQLYADDIQAYLHCSASDAIATTQVMTFIMGALGAWMS